MNTFLSIMLAVLAVYFLFELVIGLRVLLYIFR